MNRKLWVICLALWFVVWGLLAITNIRFAASDIILGVLAVVGGLCLLLDR